MNKKIQTADVSKISELTVFRVHKIICGLNIDDVQEINKHIEITKVYGAPDFVRGIINLRGQIVTVIDMRVKFGFESAEIDDKTRIVVVEAKGEDIGLLVDGIDDILVADTSNIEPPPSNIRGVTGDYFTGIMKTKKELVTILDKEKVMDLSLIHI